MVTTIWSTGSATVHDADGHLVAHLANAGTTGISDPDGDTVGLDAPTWKAIVNADLARRGALAVDERLLKLLIGRLVAHEPGLNIEDIVNELAEGTR